MLSNVNDFEFKTYQMITNDIFKPSDSRAFFFFKDRSNVLKSKALMAVLAHQQDVFLCTKMLAALLRSRGRLPMRRAI